MISLWTRESVWIPASGERCAAWLYRPGVARGGALPCVVLAHGLGGPGEAQLDAVAERFAAHGYMALVFDHRRFGASEGLPRRVLSIRRQQEDWWAAIDFARALPSVDPERIVLWGSSLGGGHVLHIAARDPRIAACIAQVPHASGLGALDAMPFELALRLSWAALRDAARAVFGAAPVYVPVVAAPGGFAAMTVPSAEDAPDGREVGERADIAARVFFDLLRYSPGRDALRIQCPLLVQVGDRDRVAARQAAERAACRAPRGELVRYPIDRHAIDLEEVFERAVEDQLHFLARHLSARAGARAIAPLSGSCAPHAS